LITVEEVTCLAGCDKGPLFQIQGDGEIKQYDNQTANSALKVITGLRQREAQRKGAQEAKG
jgi:NADH:ubiquinone oxidoreductase subunit E